MNVASLELCKELYELSGWKQEDHFYGPRWCQLMGIWDLVRAEQAVHILPIESWADGIPAYDTDFLLDKLPRRISVWFDLFDDKTVIEAYWGQDEPCKIEADTPANALCRLHIALFKRLAALTAQQDGQGEQKGGEE